MYPSRDEFTSSSSSVRWPSNQEIVRVAARFNAVIVPISGVGADESAWVVADAQEQLRVPLFGPALGA